MDGRRVNVEGSGDSADRPAFLHQGEGFLIGTEFLRPSEWHAAALGGLASFVGAMPDERAFEFGHAGEHRQHHASSQRWGGGPGFLKRLQSCIFLSDRLGDRHHAGAVMAAALGGRSNVRIG